jgi:hypothetical protein
MDDCDARSQTPLLTFLPTPPRKIALDLANDAQRYANSLRKRSSIRSAHASLLKGVANFDFKQTVRDRDAQLQALKAFLADPTSIVGVLTGRRAREVETAS